MQVTKKEGEAAGALIYRFNKKVQRSGILKEAKKRRWHDRPVSRIKRKEAALYRTQKQAQMTKLKKLGKI